MSESLKKTILVERCRLDWSDKQILTVKKVVQPVNCVIFMFSNTTACTAINSHQLVKQQVSVSTNISTVSINIYI
jgi:hypothetical protein